MRALRVLAQATLCATVLPFAACGAGLITGIASSDRGGDAAEAPPPELSIPPLLPLVPEAGAVRTVVVANAQIAASAQLRVRLLAAGVAVDQANLSAAGQGGSTLVTFTLDCAPIAAAVGDPTADDLDGTLEVLVDDRAIAAPVPVRLVRQPRAELVLVPPATERFLSPFGERVAVRVHGLRSTDLANLSMLVETDDPGAAAPPAGQPWPTVTRVCTDLQLDDTGPVPVLSAVVPGSTLPTVAKLFVRDAIAGESTVVGNAFYRPEILLALPSEGPTTGGSLVTLIGAALVPLDTSGGGPPRPDFARIGISFAKGGRVTQLAPEDFRAAESGSDRLVFTMPASPDGRPGQVDIVLEAQLGGVAAKVTASQVFLFANRKPFFGPRGIVLERAPVAVTPILPDAEPGTPAAPDFAVLTEQGGVGYLQLLLAQQNGMFQPFAAPRRIGDSEAAAERLPRDLCSGDFDGDAVPDLWLANAGAATAVHHLVLGRARPHTPLGDVFRVAGEPGTRYCRVGHFDQDELADVLLVPGDDAPAGTLPQLRLARPVAIGAPAFAPPVLLPVRPLRHDAVEIADLDGDGHQDVALFRGATLQVDIAYGNGDGTFVAGQQFDLDLPGYAADARSGAVGIHACGDGPFQSLGLVLAGLPLTLPEAPATRPTLAILPQSEARNYQPPTAVTPLPTEPNGRSLMADIDGQAPSELVLAIAGDPILASFGLLQFDPSGFQPLFDSIESGSELPRQIRALHFGRAFPPTAISPEARAVYVVHESDIDGTVERRLSTRLVYVDPDSDTRLLLPPDAGTVAGGPVQGLVGGDFHPASVANKGLQLDLALARTGAIDLIENDGYGGFPNASGTLAWAGLLPRSVALLPSRDGEIDRLVFVGDDSRVAVWRHDPADDLPQAPDAVGGELRLRSTVPGLATTPLADTTRVEVGDVDGDGLDDLVVLLSFVDPDPGEGEAAIALLRGRATSLPGELPFHEPTALTPVHGNAASIALGDFATSVAGGVELELAVAVPHGTAAGALDGNHVRFYRYRRGATPADDRFEPSAAVPGPTTLFAGSGPTELAAADFDRDGRVDLLIAGDDAALRLFRNTSLVQPGQPEVDIAAFVESLTSPQPLAPGMPTALRLTDVNGDGRFDAVATIVGTNAGGGQTTSVAFYLSSAAGEFSGPQFVSPDRVGDRDANLVLDIGDWNRDALPDLFLGWDTNGPGDRNVRVLFGGTR